MSISELKSNFLFTIRISAADWCDVGATLFRTRHIDMLGEANFDGPKLRSVVSGGMDQKIFWFHGAMSPHVRLVLKTENKTLIYMSYTELRYDSTRVMERIASGEEVDPSEYYLRNTPYSEKSAPQYDLIKRIVSMGVGRRMPNRAADDILKNL